METLTPETLPEYNHVYSRRYQKKIKKLLWAEKYFGKYIYLGYAIRYVAMIAFVLLSCFTAVKVSAELFGWEPWEYIQSFLFESRMDEKAYMKPKEESWIIWDDTSYEYMIIATSMDQAEKELLCMADSIYG